MPRDAVQREAGVTLIELLLAIAILGLIMAPITAAFIVYLKTSNNASAQLTESNGANLTTVYFAPDARSAVGFSQAATDCSGVAGEVVRIDQGGGTSISYANRNNELFRVRCSGSLSGPNPTHALVTGLDAAHPPTYSTTCVPTPCDGTMSNWSTITLTYRAQSGYDLQLQATRRT
jgi:prepilin-type N-terminal cleavage/methylation domain-containing protein